MVPMSTKEWAKAFNMVMKGYVRELKNIVPIGVNADILAKSIMVARNQYRKDIMNAGRKVPLFLIPGATDENAASESKASVDSATGLEDWPNTRGSYSPRDYQQNTRLDVESNLIEVIDSLKKQIIYNYNLNAPAVGDAVKLHMNIGHYYNGQQGSIIQTRANGQFLVQVNTRKPPYPREDDATALVWVYASDIQIL